MNFKSFKLLTIFSLLLLLLNGCETLKAGKSKKSMKVFKHNTPLIKEDVKTLGKKEIEKSAKMGPTPIEGDVKKLKKRRKFHRLKRKTIY